MSLVRFRDWPPPFNSTINLTFANLNSKCTRPLSYRIRFCNCIKEHFCWCLISQYFSWSVVEFVLNVPNLLICYLLKFFYSFVCFDFLQTIFSLKPICIYTFKESFYYLFSRIKINIFKYFILIGGV